MSRHLTLLPDDYGHWLASLKQRIQGARQRAALAANEVQIKLYHDIGREILHRQTQQGWGAKVIDQLASDLQAAFPEMKGLSASNLKYMRFFAQECPDRLIGQQSADQLPWFHIVTLITKLSDPVLGSNLLPNCRGSTSSPSLPRSEPASWQRVQPQQSHPLPAVLPGLPDMCEGFAHIELVSLCRTTQDRRPAGARLLRAEG